jgi:hypothetical protein
MIAPRGARGLQASRKLGAPARRPLYRLFMQACTSTFPIADR